MAALPKVLCLHGYTQSAKIFSQKIGAVRKACKSVEMVFIDAPLIVPMPTETEASREELDSAVNLQEEEDLKPRAWWIADETHDGLKHYRGFDDSLKLILDVISKDQYVGVFGFSQGAAMAAVVGLLLRKPALHPLLASYPSLPPFEYSILVAGFKSIDPKHAHFWTDKVEGKVVHVLGRGDAIVAEDRTAPFVEAFAAPRVEWHDGGHHVPSKAAWRAFFSSYISTKGSDDVPSPSGSKL